MERCRRELGISAADAARSIGVEPITFYRWRSGRTVPQWEHVLVASKLFRRSPEWFYADHDSEPDPEPFDPNGPEMAEEVRKGLEYAELDHLVTRWTGEKEVA
jgi:DNA-binding XRE family transcriptional regulator